MEYTDYYLTEFKKFISQQTTSVNTVKNYLSDLRVFLNYIVNVDHARLDSQTLPSYLTQSYLSRYEQFLSQANPPTTAKRRISSLKKFIDYCATQGIDPAPEDMPPIPPRAVMPSPPPDLIEPIVMPIPPPEPLLVTPAMPAEAESESSASPAVAFGEGPDIFDPIPPSSPVFIPAEIPDFSDSPDSPKFNPGPILVSAICFIAGFLLTLLINYLLNR
jgi:hypothetical protein